MIIFTKISEFIISYWMPVKKDDKPRFVLEMPLKVEQWQADILNVRYELMRRMYNRAQRILLSHFYYMVQKDEYQECASNKRERAVYIKNHPIFIKGVTDKKGNVKPITFTEFGIKDVVLSFVTRDVGSGKTYKDFGINTSFADCVASNLWAAWEKFMYDGKCKGVAFKRRFNTISIGKNNGCFGGLKLSLESMTLSVNVNGKQKGNAKFITLPVCGDNQSEYEMQALQGGLESICVVSIARKLIRGKYKYYLQLTIKGHAPNKGRALGCGTVGVDVGPSTVAFVSQSDVQINRLASECDDIEDVIGKIQQKMDRSRRATNPQNFNEDGTLKRISRKNGERRIWNDSRRYRLLCKQKAELQRKQAAVRKMSHILKINQILSLGDTFFVENNPISQWTKRAKETKVSEKTGRYCSKKRAGKSVANHAPAMFVTLLKNKVQSLGGRCREVDIKNAASRFDFTDGQFKVHGLDERIVTLSNNKTHQRDILAAFNLQHIICVDDDKKLKKYDIARMYADYPAFCDMERAEIEKFVSGEKETDRHTIGAIEELKVVLSSHADDPSVLYSVDKLSANSEGNKTGKKAGSALVHESNDRVLEVLNESTLFTIKDLHVT